MRPTTFVALLAIPAQMAIGQQAPAVNHALTLDDAISLARQNNPLLQQTKNLVRDADATIRTTYGALLPSVSASASAGYTQAGTQLVQGIPFSGTDSYNGSYRVGLNYNISAAAAFAPRAARANRAASEANVTSAAEGLRANVTTQYIQAIEQQATAAVNDTLVQTAQGQLDLANAKMKVGAGTIIDVRNAEVGLGQAEVAALQAHNQARIEKVKLFQLLGVVADTGTELTTKFAIATQPPASLDSLLTLARRVNPDLAARKSTEYANNMQVHMAQSQYLPSLGISTGLGATSFGTTQNTDDIVAADVAANQRSFANCLAGDSVRVGAGLSPTGRCQLQPLTADAIQNIRNGNNPLSFRNTPFSLAVGLSIPLFNNFQRESQIEQAKVTRDNATFDLRARNLQLTADVTTAYLNLVTAQKTVELRETTAQQAAQALAFADESYRVGSKTFLDVTTARGQFEQAAVGRVTAIYDYHKAFAALEQAVGRPLR